MNIPIAPETPDPAVDEPVIPVPPGDDEPPPIMPPGDRQAPAGDPPSEKPPVQL